MWRGGARAANPGPGYGRLLLERAGSSGTGAPPRRLLGLMLTGNPVRSWHDAPARSVASSPPPRRAVGGAAVKQAMALLAYSSCSPETLEGRVRRAAARRPYRSFLRHPLGGARRGRRARYLDLSSASLGGGRRSRRVSFNPRRCIHPRFEEAKRARASFSELVRTA